MVISQLDGGLGNQMDQYAVGRCLAYKLKTEFKLMLQRPFIPKESKVIANYRLGDFNIQEVFATPEEIKRVKEQGIVPASGEDLKKIYEARNITYLNILNTQFALEYERRMRHLWLKFD